MRTGGELAIDLGTANTLVFRMGEGIVLNQPTVVAVNARNGEVLALGDEAWEMVGQASSRTVAVRPLRRGAITEYETTRQMIRLILKQVGVTRWSKPRALVCIPSAVSEVERRAVEEATRSAGARSVTLIEEPMAAAIGAGLPTHEPIGSFVVDVGGGTTEVAMVSMGGLIARRAVRVGGFDMDAAIQQHVRKEYGLAIGDRAAEQVKITAGAAYPLTDAPAAEIRGREILTGMPKSARLSAWPTAPRSSATTSSSEACSSVGAVGSFAAWTCGSRRSARCRCISPTIPWKPWSWVPADASSFFPKQRGCSRRGEGPTSTRTVTFSIVAADPGAGDWGVAVASKFPAVGVVVPWPGPEWGPWPRSPGPIPPSVRGASISWPRASRRSPRWIASSLQTTTGTSDRWGWSMRPAEPLRSPAIAAWSGREACPGSTSPVRGTSSWGRTL
jgi:rod shape-determining protein MreB